MYVCMHVFMYAYIYICTYRYVYRLHNEKLEYGKFVGYRLILNSEQLQAAEGRCCAPNHRTTEDVAQGTSEDDQVSFVPSLM